MATNTTPKIAKPITIRPHAWTRAVQHDGPDHEETDNQPGGQMVGHGHRHHAGQAEAEVPPDPQHLPPLHRAMRVAGPPPGARAV